MSRFRYRTLSRSLVAKKKLVRPWKSVRTKLDLCYALLCCS